MGNGIEEQETMLHVKSKKDGVAGEQNMCGREVRLGKGGARSWDDKETT